MQRRRVVRAFYGLSGTYTLAASLIWSVNTLFLLDAGLTIGQVFVANAAFSIGMFAFEIPTGVVADTLGRRVSYLFSVAVLAVTTVLYLVLARTGQGVVAFAVVSVFLGLGFTFYSGALEAWLVDALNAVDGDQDLRLDHIFARAQQVSGAAMLIGTVGGGFLGQIDLSLPFVVRAALLGLLFVGAGRLMRDQGFTPRALTLRTLPAEMSHQARVGISAGWSRRGLRALMLTSAVASGFMFWAFYAAQPYLLELLRRDAVWVVGVVTAGIAVATMIGNQTVTWLSRRCQRRSTLLAWSFGVVAAASVALGSTDRFAFALVALLVIGAAFGVVEPVHRAYLHTVTASEHRATVASLDAMIGAGGGAVGQVGLGYVSDARSFATGYVVAGAVSLLALPLLWAVRRAGGAGDQIVGRVVVQGSCGAEGLPLVAQVESNPVAEVVGQGEGVA